MWVNLADDPDIFLPCTWFLFQQTSDNAEMVKDIEQRVQSLSGVLAAPVSEDDHTEKWRRMELRRFVPAQMHVTLLTPSQEARGGYCEA